MKKLLMSIALCAAAASAAGAVSNAPVGALGLGPAVGAPMGASVKYFYDDALAFDGGIGYDNAAVFYADILANNWTLLPQPKSGRANVYAGAGPRVATDGGGQFAIRAIAGAGYWPTDKPLELFAEVGPTFKVSPDNTIGVDGGLGFRYYFDFWPAKR